MNSLFLFDMPGGSGIVLFFLFALLIWAIYFSLIPYFIAKKNNHPYKTQILLICLFLGWTLIFWVGALIWATMPPKEKPLL